MRHRSPRWMMPGEVYAYRTRKPAAILGLPILGRHWGYVGQTRNPKARHGEHMNGGGRYGGPAQPWSDLRPQRYVLFRLSHCPQWVLNVMEVLLIKLLLPVYNVTHNKGNPRRIRPALARVQRHQRDLMKWSPHFTWAHLYLLLAVSLALALV